MNARERQTVTIGGVLAGILLFYMLLIRPLSNAVDDADAQIQARQATLQDMEHLAEEARVLRDALPRRAENVNLLSYIEGLTRQTGLQGNIDSMKMGGGVSRGDSRRQSVEIKLVRLNLKETMTFLYQLEHGGRYPLQVHDINIRKRFDNPELLDVTLEAF